MVNLPTFSSIVAKPTALPANRPQKHPVSIQSANGSYSFASQIAEMQKFRTMRRNTLMASAIASFAGFVYFYSIWAVKQDDLNDEFLAKVTQDNAEYLHNIQQQQKEMKE